MDTESQCVGNSGTAESVLPFDALDLDEVRKLHGMIPAAYDSCHTLPVARYNYVAAFTKEKLRRSCLKIVRNVAGREVIPEFPLEIILQIIEYLHPLDLYHMSLSTKYFRLILLTKRLSGLAWDAAFQRHPEIPPCPATMSAPSWASLLFGQATCDRCLHRQAMPDFASCQRICRPCEIRLSKEYCVIWDQYCERHPTERNHLYEILLYSTKPGGMLYGEQTTANYAINDIPVKVALISPYLEALNAGASTAMEEYKSFLTRCELEKKKFLEHVQICSSWCSKIYSERFEVFQKKLAQFTDLACDLMIRNGHDARDVIPTDVERYFSQYFSGTKHIHFSKKVFYRNIPGLEVVVNSAKEYRLKCEQAAKEFRLKCERAALRQLLRKRVSLLYTNLLQTSVPPERWDYIPATDEHILDLPAVAYYTDTVYASARKTPKLASTDIDNIIIAFAEKLMTKTERHLAHILKKSHPAASLWQDEGGDGLERVGLATAVFTPPRRPGSQGPSCDYVLIGYGEVARHGPCASLLQDDSESCCDLQNDFRFSRIAYDTIVLLLRLLRMNPDTALASDVDTLRKRFICMSCPLERNDRGVRGRRTMDWRDCARHSLECSNRNFALLTVDVTKSVLFQENGGYYVNRDAVELKWSCKHCPQHFESLVTEKQVIKHVIRKHKIPNPTEHINYFHSKRSDYFRSSKRRQPFRNRGLLLEFCSLGKSLNRRCMLCQGTSNEYRLWTSYALEEHQAERHGLLVSTEGVHWLCPPLIDRTTDELKEGLYGPPRL